MSERMKTYCVHYTPFCRCKKQPWDITDRNRKAEERYDTFKPCISEEIEKQSCCKGYEPEPLERHVERLHNAIKFLMEEIKIKNERMQKEYERKFDALNERHTHWWK